MKVGRLKPMAGPLEAHCHCSRTVGKRTEYNTGEKDARTFEPPVSLQLTLQLSRYGILVCWMDRQHFAQLLIYPQIPRARSHERR